MKFLFLLILFFFLFSPIIRMITRVFLVKKMSQFQNGQPQKKPTRKEGDIRIDNASPKHQQKTGNSEGHYIDFEEVKD